ncbi:hypothetical protein AnigIFM56816_006363 [Aspergillus niger]|nr:hypothetical protein AnigIFM56816_006363 [Aspergillus niger]
MGKRKAKDTSQYPQKRRSPRVQDKQGATGMNAIKPEVPQSTDYKSALELKASPEVQGSTEDKLNASSTSEPTASPEIQTSTEAKIDTCSDSEPSASPGVQASTEAKIDSIPASEPTTSLNVKASTEAEQPEVALDEHGLPKLPEERRPGQPIVWTCPRSLTQNGEWQEAFETTRGLFLDLDMLVLDWIDSHCYGEGKLRDRLSAGDLQIILDSLGDFCLYKDWKSIEARLGKSGRHNFWFQLPEAVLMKHLFEDVIVNPFVYIEGSRENTGGQSSMDPPAFGQELWGLWKKLAKVDPVRASDWRKTTIQLLNQVHPKHTKDWLVAYRTGEAQDSLAHQLATGMLTKCKALQLILKETTKPDGVAQRYAGLVEIYRSALEVTVYLGTLDTEFEFELDVRRCGPFLHRRTRVRKRGCSDEIYPDEWPDPVLLSLPLVSGRYLVTSDDIARLQTLRGEVRYSHRNDGEEVLQKRLDKEVPEVEEGDTILYPAIHFAQIVFAKDGPRACSCGGRFICQNACEKYPSFWEEDDEEDEDDGGSDSKSTGDD